MNVIKMIESNILYINKTYIMFCLVNAPDIEKKNVTYNNSINVKNIVLYIYIYIYIICIFGSTNFSIHVDKLLDIGEGPTFYDFVRTKNKKNVT